MNTERKTPLMNRLPVAVVHLLLCTLLFTAAASAQWAPRNPVTGVKQQADGVVFTMQTGTLKVLICTDSMVHVLYSASATFPNHPDFVIIKNDWSKVPWTVSETADDVAISTSKLKVSVTRIDGAITYRDSDGKQLLQEATRKLTPVEVNGENTYRAESFVSIYGSHEALYGLGQHQAGVWNYRGESVDISQDNANISVPLLVSSNGYGIFWNSSSRSRFNNRFPNYLYISSEVADAVDYYFIYGPELDKVVADGPGSNVRQVGLWVLAMQEPLQDTGRDSGCGPEISGPAHSGRQHCAGLVLVGPQGGVCI